FLHAMRSLLDRGVISPSTLRLRFRAPVHEASLKREATRAGVAQLLDVLPPIDYRAALREMQAADALLVLQAANCNAQIPAKLYEYFRARRPILALTDPAGDTARTLLRSGYDAIAPLDDAAAIASLFESFVKDPRALASRLPGADVVASH